MTLKAQLLQVVQIASSSLAWKQNCEDGLGSDESR